MRYFDKYTEDIGVNRNSGESLADELQKLKKAITSVPVQSVRDDSFHLLDGSVSTCYLEIAGLTFEYGVRVINEKPYLFWNLAEYESELPDGFTLSGVYVDVWRSTGAGRVTFYTSENFTEAVWVPADQWPVNLAVTGVVASTCGAIRLRSLLPVAAEAMVKKSVFKMTDYSESNQMLTLTEMLEFIQKRLLELERRINLR